MPSAQGFDEIFAVVPRSRVYTEIMRVSAGSDALPDWATPYSLVGVRELTQIADALGVGPGQTFADLACGPAGPSLLVAERTGASLIGVDWSTEAIAAARRTASERGLDRRASFVVADVTSTGLPDASLDGVMSVDAIQFVEAAAVAGEIARILRPGAVAALTTWDSADPPIPTMVPDYRPVFEAAGMRVLSYGEPAGAKERNAAQFAEVRRRATDLLAEIGPIAQVIIREAGSAPAMAERMRRVLLIARKE